MRKNLFSELQQARRRACGAGPSSERGGVCSTHPHALRYNAIRTKTTKSSRNAKCPYGVQSGHCRLIRASERRSLLLGGLGDMAGAGDASVPFNEG